MSEVSTIVEATTACRDTIRMATTVSWLMREEWAENRLADFNLWSAGAGASTTGNASLDHRLRANPEAHSILINLLLMLKILIQKCIDREREIEDAAAEASSKELAKGKAILEKLTSGSTKDEYTKFFSESAQMNGEETKKQMTRESAKTKKDVEDSLNQLTRLTVAILKAGNRSRLLKADSLFDPSGPQMRSLRRHLEIILLVHPGENGSSASNTQQLDPARLSAIQQRLIEANLRRRNRFLYAQKHSQKLGNNPEYPENTPRERPALAKHTPLSGVSNIPSISQEETPLMTDDIKAQSTTTATALDEPLVIPPTFSFDSTYTGTEVNDPPSQESGMVKWDRDRNNIHVRPQGPRKKMTRSQKAHRRALRQVGGACEACRKRKKKCTHKDLQLNQSTTSVTTAISVSSSRVSYPKTPAIRANQSTTSATTVVSVTSSRVSYPNPPPIRDGQMFFTCPCCCQSLPAAVGRGNLWKKHLMRDILPYTCIIDNCTMTDTFYVSKEAWLSHMNKEHEGIEQWECHACSQKNIHATFRESDDFTAHLQNQHSKGIRPQQIPMLRSAWRHKAPFKIPACPLCCFESVDQKILLDHIAEHIHSFALRSLPWVPREGLEDENNEEIEEEGSYFKQHPYFDVNSCRTESSLRSSRVSSLSIDLGAIAGSDSGETSISVHEKQQLTEESLNQVPHDILGQTSTRGWLETLSNEPESPHPSTISYWSDSTTTSNQFTKTVEDEDLNQRSLASRGKALDTVKPATIHSVSKENRVCPSCIVEEHRIPLSTEMELVWYCCQCRDGPFSWWQRICQACGHGSGSI